MTIFTIKSHPIAKNIEFDDIVFFIVSYPKNKVREAIMQKYYNIWKNDWHIYHATLTPSRDIIKEPPSAHFEYVATVAAKSPLDAINVAYTELKERYAREYVFDATWMDKPEPLIWAKALREIFPLCPLSIAIYLAKLLLYKTDDLSKVKTLTLRKEELVLDEEEMRWFTQEEDAFEGDLSVFYQRVAHKPQSRYMVAPMFGEDAAQDEYEEKISDISYQILEYVPECDRAKVMDLIDKLTDEAGKRYDNFIIR